ncbi:hypothetical protein JCM3765_002220 [Sporobolomyces pararoseus]
MEDEELDPAFADLDFPTADPSTFQELEFHHGSLDELGQDSFEGHVLGNGLGGELFLGGQGQEGESFEFDQVGDLEGRRRGVEHGLNDDLEESGNRMSLAFELASASESNGRGSSLLRELGLEEGEEEEEEEERNQSDFGEAELSRGIGGRQVNFARMEGQQEEEVSDLDGRRASLPLSSQSSTPHLRSKSSTTSLAEDSFDEHGIETSFKEITTSLEESISSIQTSLDHLRDNLRSSVTTTIGDPSTSATVLSCGSFADRQPLVETLASSLVKSLYSTSKVRETQVRSMTEYERMFSRTDSVWESVLSELEAIPLEEAEAESLPISSTSSSLDTPESSSHPSSRTTVSSASSRSSLASTSDPLPVTKSNGTLSSHSPASGSTNLVTSDLQQLRDLTSAILSAFTSVSDIVQVQSALTSEGGRKLRALRTQVASFKEEFLQLDQSEAFIMDFEEKARLVGRRDYAEEARLIMKGVETELELSTGQARNILKVH